MCMSGARGTDEQQLSSFTNHPCIYMLDVVAHELFLPALLAVWSLVNNRSVQSVTPSEAEKFSKLRHLP